MGFSAKRIFIILLNLISSMSMATSSTAPLETITVPNSEYLIGLEYSCMKHIQAKQLFRALEILNVMNWQCAEKQGFNMVVTSSNNQNTVNQYLEEAKQARTNFLKTHKPEEWVCDPRPIFTQAKQEFYSGIAKKAMDHLLSRGVTSKVANIIIAQIAQETAWGKKVKGNNYFNIKGSYHGESVQFTTSEEYASGKWTKIVDNFRKYPSLEASIDDYINVLAEKWPDSYRAMFSKNDENADRDFVGALKAGKKGGYATDRQYSMKLKLLGEQVKFEMSGRVPPTYLKCLGRES